jgi:hypothetical protein
MLKNLNAKFLAILYLAYIAHIITAHIDVQCMHDMSAQLLKNITEPV